MNFTKVITTLIFITLTSCFASHKYTDRIRAEKKAIYKIVVSDEDIEKILQEKLEKVLKIVKESDRRLNNCINNLYLQVIDRNLIKETKMETFNAKIREGIKILSSDFKEQILKYGNIILTAGSLRHLLSNIYVSVEQKWDKIIKNIIIKNKNIRKEVLLYKGKLFKKLLLEAIELEYLPFIIYLKLKNVKLMLQEGINENLAYEYIINNKLEELSREVIRSEKAALECLKKCFLSLHDGKVEIGFEGYDFKEPLYITEVKEEIQDKNSFKECCKGLINLDMKVIDGVVYYEDTPLKLKKIE